MCKRLVDLYGSLGSSTISSVVDTLFESLCLLRLSYSFFLCEFVQPVFDLMMVVSMMVMCYMIAEEQSCLMHQ